MSKLVSVIIPCYNAERWIAEAIESCLKQTYPFIEVVVIDDGSTDRSLEVIKRYADRVIWETDSNRGGNHARNRGFALSHGDYIQYLDADDYILPEKVERQVRFLEETGVDVVYGDWRHQRHLPNGNVILEDVKVSGEQGDILAALLSDWWVSPACLLFNRQAVQASGGWDEALKAVQDKDFFISVAMSGAKIEYQPGCYSIYRRYGDVTVSTSSKTRRLESQLFINRKIENRLNQSGRFSEIYQKALAQSYFLIARECIEVNPSSYKELLKKTLSLDPDFKADSTNRTAIYSFIQDVLGFRELEKLVATLKFIKNSVRNKVLYFKQQFFKA